MCLLEDRNDESIGHLSLSNKLQCGWFHFTAYICGKLKNVYNTLVIRWYICDFALGYSVCFK